MSKSDFIKNLAAFSFLIVLSIWVGYHLFILVLCGSGVIKEPNRWVSIPELIFTIGIFLLSVERYINIIKKRCRRLL